MNEKEIRNESTASENENEDLRFDALASGIADGGLRSTLEINLLICYITVNSRGRLTEKVIADTMMRGEIANYFETVNAIKKLKQKGMITEDGKGYLHPGDGCKNLVDLVENDLPYTIRKKSIEISRKLAVRETFEKENKVDIEKHEDYYSVTMHLADGDKEFMALTLNLPTAAQAETVKDCYYNNPVEIYNTVIDALFGAEIESE